MLSTSDISRAFWFDHLKFCLCVTQAHRISCVRFCWCIFGGFCVCLSLFEAFFFKYQLFCEERLDVFFLYIALNRNLQGSSECDAASLKQASCSAWTRPEWYHAVLSCALSRTKDDTDGWYHAAEKTVTWPPLRLPPRLRNTGAKAP